MAGTAAAARPDVRPPQHAQAEGGMGWLAWAVTLLVLGAIGFVGWRLFDPTHSEDGPGPVAPTDTAAPPAANAERGPEPATGTEDGVETPSASAEPDEMAADLPAPYGREEDGVTSLPGVQVGEGEGLLVLEPAPGGAPMTARIGERELRVEGEPLGVAVPEGVHHVTVLRGDNQDYIWVLVRAGHTRFVPPLP